MKKEIIKIVFKKLVKGKHKLGIFKLEKFTNSRDYIGWQINIPPKYIIALIKQ